MTPKFLTFTPNFSAGTDTPAVTENSELASTYETSEKAIYAVGQLQDVGFPHDLVVEPFGPDLHAIQKYRLRVIDCEPDDCGMTIQPVRLGFTNRIEQKSASGESLLPTYEPCRPAEAECFALYVRIPTDNPPQRNIHVADYPSYFAACDAIHELKFRRFQLDSISQSTDQITFTEVADWNDFLISGYLDNEDDANEITPAILIAMKIGDSRKYGGGAAPLMQITRFANHQPDCDTTLFGRACDCNDQSDAYPTAA